MVNGSLPVFGTLYLPVDFVSVKIGDFEPNNLKGSVQSAASVHARANAGANHSGVSRISAPDSPASACVVPTRKN
jgi:hypothetical protein